MQRDSEAIAAAMAALTETVVKLCGVPKARGDALAKQAVIELGDLRVLIEGKHPDPAPATEREAMH